MRERKKQVQVGRCTKGRKEGKKERKEKKEGGKEKKEIKIGRKT